MEKIKQLLPSKEQIKQAFPKLKEKDIELLLHISQKTGLDILQKQIYAVERGGATTIQTSIDGFRLIAERTGKYAPGKESTFEYDSKGELVKATSFIKKQTEDGIWHEVSVSAFMKEFNANSPFWKKMPHVMLSKVAEAAALRRAFPDTLGGLYTSEEMAQATVESEENEPEEPPKNTLPPIHVEEIKKRFNGDKNLVVEFGKEFGVKNFTELKKDQYRSAIDWIETHKEIGHDIPKAQ
jgi:phage recombination protein Bet